MVPHSPRQREGPDIARARDPGVTRRARWSCHYFGDRLSAGRRVAVGIRVAGPALPATRARPCSSRGVRARVLRSSRRARGGCSPRGSTGPSGN